MGRRHSPTAAPSRVPSGAVTFNGSNGTALVYDDDGDKGNCTYNKDLARTSARLDSTRVAFWSSPSLFETHKSGWRLASVARGRDISGECFDGKPRARDRASFELSRSSTGSVLTKETRHYRAPVASQETFSEVISGFALMLKGPLSAS